MTRREIEEISRQWEAGVITAEEMAKMIKGKGLKFCSTFKHRIMKGTEYLRCPGCDKQL